MQTAPLPLVLVVDDERPLVELVRDYLEREGFAVASAADGPSAVQAARTVTPAVIVLDVMLPGFDGLEVLRQVRTFSDPYVLLLTARGEEVDRIVGLTVGADDYLVKPFSPRELVARIRALLRRPRSAGPRESALSKGLALDVPRHEVRVDGEVITLTAIEFALLAALAARPGVVLARPQLLEAVWGTAFVGDDHLVDVHVANLRRKLGDDPAAPRFVETIRSVGYRLRGA